MYDTCNHALHDRRIQACHFDTGTLAERLWRRPAKPMKPSRVGSNPTGVDLSLTPSDLRGTRPMPTQGSCTPPSPHLCLPVQGRRFSADCCVSLGHACAIYPGARSKPRVQQQAIVILRVLWPLRANVCHRSRGLQARVLPGGNG